MKAILLPVKNFHAAKTRLAPHYSPVARAALAADLCKDCFQMIAGVRGVDRVFVVSGEPIVLEWARGNGWETIAESEQISESHSVDTASRKAAERGVHAVLRLPVDIPLAQANDVEELFACLEDGPGCVLVGSRDGTGTNAVLRSPPALFPSHFGPDSFRLHLDEARACGAPVKILRNPRLELDIDEYDDLAVLDGHVPPDSKTGQWMIENFRAGERRSAE